MHAALDWEVMFLTDLQTPTPKSPPQNQQQQQHQHQQNQHQQRSSKIHKIQCYKKWIEVKLQKI